MREPRNRVVQVRRFGDPDGLAVVDAPLPTAGRGEVRVRVLASGLEYTDVLIRRHLYPQTIRRHPPFVIGYDVVGEIDQLGDGVSGFQTGDRVADMTVLGSNAAYRTLHLNRLWGDLNCSESSWGAAHLLHAATVTMAHAMRRKTAPLRYFSPLYVRYGSILLKKSPQRSCGIRI